MTRIGCDIKMGNKKKKAEKTVKKTAEPADDLSKKLFEVFGIDDLDEIGSRLGSATYYACMLIRCNAIARLPIKVRQRTKNGGSVELPEHSLYELLHLRPNRHTSAHDFIWATEFQRLHYGNAFWVKDNTGGDFRGLYLLESPRVEIYVDDAKLIGDDSAVYYVYNDPRQGRLLYGEDDIVHLKNFARCGIVGESMRKYLDSLVQNEQYAQNFLHNKYKNGLQDPVVVTYTGDIGDALSQKVKKKFEKLGGVKQAGKVIPIPSDFDIKTLKTSLVDAQFAELGKLTARQIANAFGVKSFQLNDLEKSTYSNITQQNTAFYSDTLLNVIVGYEQELEWKLLFDFERAEGKYINFNTDIMLRADLLTRYQAHQIGISSGFEKISEVRHHEDMPFVKGTDRLIYGNGAAVFLDDLGKAYAKEGEKNE